MLWQQSGGSIPGLQCWALLRHRWPARCRVRLCRHCTECRYLLWQCCKQMGFLPPAEVSIARGIDRAVSSDGIVNIVTSTLILHRESEKVGHPILLPISLPYLDRFSKFFHRWTPLWLCNELIMIHLKCVATLPCKTLLSLCPCGTRVEVRIGPLCCHGQMS